jgi:hypothetical protein
MKTVSYESFIGKLSTQVAIASFAVGTLLLLLGVLFRANGLILVTGYIYLVTAFLGNGLMLFILLVFCLKNWDKREYYAIKMLILLANVPIAFLYFFVLIYSYGL